jgi:Heterokaryon incompatibility protein (HET)
MQNQRYTTLSHCWGGGLPLRTLDSNLHSYGKRIPTRSIPQTFKDAIAITQSLGIQYLWIDALCIVQNSQEEWEQEAAKMKDVYSGSNLNIAASDAPGSESGCFPVISSTVRFLNVIDPHDDSELMVRLQVGDTRHLTKETNLSSRGWVLQEQLLSHRMISCMGNEVHWECGETYKTDHGAEFHHLALDVRGIPRLHQSSLNLQREGVWRSWMTNFSRRQFTFWKDRLPALSGIVQYYENTTGDLPFLGLWKSSLLQDMLWIRSGPIHQRALHEIKALNLPSWSWLSCPSEIEFDIWQITRRTNSKDPHVVQHYSELVSDTVEWNGIPFVSAVASAYIVLDGPAIEIFIDVDKESPLSDPPSFKLEAHGQCMLCEGQFDRCDVTPGSYLGLFLQSREHTHTKARRDTLLILESVTVSTYERVGIACVFDGNLLTKATRKIVHIC